LAAELGGNQISALLETLPGIANVLRSPVADALLNLIRAAAGLRDFNVQDADELVKYAVRRGLVGSDEGDRVMAEIQSEVQRRADRAAERQKARKEKEQEKEREKAVAKSAPKPAPRPAKTVPRSVKAVKNVKPAKAVKKASAKGKKR